MGFRYFYKLSRGIRPSIVGYNTSSMIQANLEQVRFRIAAAARAAGRLASSVRLIGITKGVSPERIREAIACGITEVGENRVQEAQEKKPLVGSAGRWHLVGHLQRNKVRSALQLFDWIDSVDHLDLGEALERVAAQRNDPVDILVQVNAAQISTRFGVIPEETPALVERLRRFRHLRLRGLMAMAPFAENPETVRPIFRQVKRLADDLQLTELSMGMSQDFEVAIQEGATMVRIGAAIFGER